MAHPLARHFGEVGKHVWDRLPGDWRSSPPFIIAGNCIHDLALKTSNRSQSLSTWFLRNEPLLLTIRDLVVDNFKYGAQLQLCVIACSTGAEMYSVLWMLRSARPDLKILATGVDISELAIAKAKSGRYNIHDTELTGGLMQSRREPVLPEELIAQLFEREGDELRIKQSIAEDVKWDVSDARLPTIRGQLGGQDIVMANNFLVHMKPRDAAPSLYNLATLVKPGGILVCRGIDLDVREAVTHQLGFSPVQTRIEEIHNAGPELDARRHWPWKYFGLEPLNKRRRNWIRRYAAIFRAPA